MSIWQFKCCVIKKCFLNSGGACPKSLFVGNKSKKYNVVNERAGYFFQPANVNSSSNIYSNIIKQFRALLPIVDVEMMVDSSLKIL